MKWIEIITLRSAGETQRNMITEFLKQVEHASKQCQPQDVRVYRHASVETDLSVHIYWDRANVAQPRSNLGDLLIRAARDFGMVSTSVWIEEERISGES
jgi:hypothetical protein